MALPTVNVTIQALDPTNNAPVIGGAVTARLTVGDTYQGQIVPRDTISGVTDNNGQCILPLFPNSLGEVKGDFCGDGVQRNTSYLFVVKNAAGKTIYKTVATVPNQAVNLLTIAGNACAPQPALPTALPGFHDAETPAGVLNGVNKKFTLGFAPNPPQSLILTLNGLTQNPLSGLDFLLVGNVITFIAAPQPGDVMLAWYRT